VAIWFMNGARVTQFAGVGKRADDLVDPGRSD
jgi:hypothetical protein